MLPAGCCRCAGSPALVAALAAGLRAGQSFALAYGAAKRAAGAVDFDDLIREAERLLLTPGMGDWVRYKLDQQTDHILVDEAQDTNERQWNIVRALAGEYFAGRGRVAAAPDDLHRRRLQAGDLRLPGHRSGELRRRPRLVQRARRAAIERDFLDLSMDRSFRSSPPILAVGRPGDRRSRPRGARPAAPAQPAREPPCRPAGLGRPLAARSPTRAARTRKPARKAGSATPTRRYAGAAGAGRSGAWLDTPFHAREPAAGRSGPRTS